MSITIDGKKYDYVPDGDGFKLVPVSEGGAGSEKLHEENSDKKKTASEEEDNESDDCEDDDDDNNDGEDEAVLNRRQKSCKPLRCFWSTAEEEKLLDLCYEKHIIDKMDGKCGNLTHAKIFKSISVPLNSAKLGKSPKTAAQCKAKFKKMKKSYFDCVKQHKKSGAGRSECKHFERLNLLFGKRPRAVCQDWAVDSQANTKDAEEDSEDVDDASSEPAPPVRPPSTSSCSSSASGTSATLRVRLPPKYKSVGSRSNSIANAMNSIMLKSVETLERQNLYFAQQMEAQSQVQKEMMLTISQSLNSGIAALVGALSNPVPTPSPQTFLQPHFPQSSNSATIPNINYAAISVPSQQLSHPPQMNFASVPPSSIQTASNQLPEASPFPHVSTSFFANPHQASPVQTPMPPSSPQAPTANRFKPPQPSPVQTPATSPQAPTANRFKPPQPSPVQTPATSPQAPTANRVQPPQPSPVQTPATSPQAPTANRVKPPQPSPGRSPSPAASPQIASSSHQSTSVRPLILSPRPMQSVSTQPRTQMLKLPNGKIVIVTSDKDIQKK